MSASPLGQGIRAARCAVTWDMQGDFSRMLSSAVWTNNCAQCSWSLGYRKLISYADISLFRSFSFFVGLCWTAAVLLAWFGQETWNSCLLTAFPRYFSVPVLMQKRRVCSAFSPSNLHLGVAAAS